MVPNEGTHLLLCHSHGQTSAYRCTLANAKAAFATHEQALLPEVAALARDMTQPGADFALMVSDTLIRALDELLAAQPGAELPQMRKALYGPPPSDDQEDRRPLYVATAADREELALWLFRNGFTVNKRTGLDDESLKSLSPQDELAFLAPLRKRHAKPVRFVSSEIYSGARDLKALKADRWREDAPEHRIVERYVTFINEWLVNPRNERYEVVAVEADYR